MPGLNGLDLARYLRQSFPQTKVIIVTGYSTRDIEKTASALSVTAVLKKPFGLDTLGEIVRRSLGNGTPAQSVEAVAPHIMEPLDRQLNILKRDTGALWVGLYGIDSQLLAHTNFSDDLGTMLEQIVVSTWPAQVAQFAQQGGPCFVFIDRQPYDIYLSSVNTHHCLALIYDRRWQANRMGAVWLTARQSAQEIAHLLASSYKQS